MSSMESLEEKADQLINLVTDLDSRLEASNEALLKLQKSDERTRRFKRFASVSLMLSLLLFIAVGSVALNAKSASENAQQALREGCEIGNDARAAQIVLWDYIINFAPPPTTPEAQTRIDNLKTFIKTTFAPRDCNSL